jgi:hypothetical protein
MATKIVSKYQIALRRLYLNQSPGKRISSLIGISKEQFVEYINKQLLPGMTYDSFGKDWGLDHIVPTDMFDHTNINDLKLCWNFNNIMPMFINDNRKKGASVHFSLEKLNSLPDNEIVQQLKSICEKEIDETWKKYIL